MAAEILRRIIDKSERHQILWIAENGAEAVMYCNQQKPDLVLMDLMMPVMDGVEATRRIMASSPCAILVVTATVTGHSSKVFEAMGAGALDAVATPVFGAKGHSEGGKELLRKIDIMEKLIGHATTKGKKTATSGLSLSAKKRQEKYMVAIGCSTGGPQATIKVLSALPANLQAAVTVIQHMDKKFTTGLANWLNSQIKMPVRTAKEGDRPMLSQVLLPATDNHLVMTWAGNLNYKKEPIDNYYHPSVDVFFESIAKHWQGKIIAILLTGMGRDGAQGLLTLKEHGCHTIAQDEESSVVYGMPKAAVELNAAKEVLPLAEIGPRILQLVNQ